MIFLVGMLEWGELKADLIVTEALAVVEWARHALLAALSAR
jgi:hypothetical protein